MAKKLSAKERTSMETKQNLVTTCIACIVLLCVLITGMIVVIVRAQNEANGQIAWQSAFARHFGGDGETALDILTRDYNVGVDELYGFGPVVSVIEGTAAAEGFEWGVWVNGDRITDRPASQINTRNGDKIVWQLVAVDNGDSNN
ncbi:hypothetical protein FWC63_00060 [Candidatus Saccharibacteria bacterium]|nr:hypothetical protein [Candidatus Saccharibacteria bacterium]